AFANGIAVPGRDDVVLFDSAARVIGRIPYAGSSDGLVPFQDGVLAITTYDDATASVLAYWVSEGDEAIERWTVELAGHMQAPMPFGDRIALASYVSGLRIFDAAGGELAALPTTKIVDDVAAFGGGIAVSVRDNPQVLWWRPGEALATLDHDGSADKLRTVPAGLITSESNVLFLWRTDEQGPEWTPVTSPLPMNVPIVVGGGAVTITAAGRFALRGVTPKGQSRRISPEAAWRPLTTRDEAARLMERLVGRTFDGPLPALSDAVILYEVEAQLSQLPLAETVDLYGRTLFAQSTLDERTLQYASHARGSFFEELGQALGTSGRVLLAAVKSRKLKLEPPRPIAGYDYLGTFTTSGDLTVSDPCYIGKKQNPSFPLTLKVQGLEGVWHAFARGGAGDDRDRNAEAVFIHDDGFEVYANELIGSIGVDSGTAGVFDKKCPKRDDNVVLEEGTFAALGAVVSTGYGDGFYAVLAGKAKGKVAKIRIHFIGDDLETDRSMPKSTAQAKPYSASQKFAMGDTLDHVKFGRGSVVRVGGDGKVDVRFADGIRTLVHAKK
nr:hypothetical protein [Deltaproteobacteria bacterium]